MVPWAVPELYQHLFPDLTHTDASSADLGGPWESRTATGILPALSEPVRQMVLDMESEDLGQLPALPRPFTNHSGFQQDLYLLTPNTSSTHHKTRCFEALDTHGDVTPAHCPPANPSPLSYSQASPQPPSKAGARCQSIATQLAPTPSWSHSEHPSAMPGPVGPWASAPGRMGANGAGPQQQPLAQVCRNRPTP